MRNAFIDGLIECARRDRSIWLLCADLGFSVLEPFQQEFPDRFINVGVAEANMIGVAAGLALSGKNVFVYSIIPFAVMRPLEQIRVDLCVHKLPVTVVGVGAGMTYGAQGTTHHAIEDVALMRALPNMTVVCPGDVVEARAAARALAELSGPAYVRLSRAGSPTLHDGPIDFNLGRAITMSEGSEVTMISAGHVLDCTVSAATILRKRGLSVGLLSMHTVKPIDTAAIKRAARSSSLIVTVEEHSVVGGLGGAVAEVVAGGPTHAPLVRIGVPDSYFDEVGSQDYLRKLVGLTPETIAETVQRELSANRFVRRRAV